jgi:TRAP-type C4-dicarboxylate transport system permease small subunit
MLFITWLVFKGSLEQARINWDVAAPVTGASGAIFYASGIVFAVSAAVLIARDLWRVLSGQLSEAELVMVKESEEQGELEALQAELARENAAHAHHNGGRP